MRHARVALLLAVGVLASARDVSAAARNKKPRSVRKAQSIAQCPSFRQERFGPNQNEGLRFHLRNACAFPLACTLSWNVHCRDADVTSPGTRSAPLDLGPGATESTVAAGSACGRGGWDIDDIQWKCDRAKPEADVAKEKRDPALPTEL